MASRVLDRLRHGVPAGQMRSPFEPLTLPIYLMILLELAGAGALGWIQGFRIELSAIAALPLLVVPMIFSAMLFRRYSSEKLTGCMEAIALDYFQGFSVLLLMIVLTPLSAPLADGKLAAADHLLGFDWKSFAGLFARNEAGLNVLSFVYKSFLWQSPLILICLFATGFQLRGWQMAVAGTIAALLDAAIFPLAPAVGTFYHFGVSPADFPGLRGGWQFGPVLVALKNGSARTIEASLFTGLVSFPSYHAVAATIFSWAVWPLRRLRWIFLCLNIAMCGAAIIVGAHYLVDVIAGILVGSASIALSRIVTSKIERLHRNAVAVGDVHPLRQKQIR